MGRVMQNHFYMNGFLYLCHGYEKEKDCKLCYFGESIPAIQRRTAGSSLNTHVSPLDAGLMTPSPIIAVVAALRLMLMGESTLMLHFVAFWKH